jgi:hypothetical protein
MTMNPTQARPALMAPTEPSRGGDARREGPVGDDLLPHAESFSLVLGGPLYQLWLRTRLARAPQKLVRRRVLAFVLVAWLPLLFLASADGTALGQAVQLPFLRDVELHLRLLVAMPLLLVAEAVTHERMRPVVALFVERGLVPDESRGRFDSAIGSALRLRNSIFAELLMVAIVYGVGVLFVWRTQVALDVTSWYGIAASGTLVPSRAGWWMGCVSLPLFQFLLLRWYFRFFIWARFLWQVSHIELNLLATHPDCCGGLGFLTTITSAFAPVLMAQGVALAGMIANRIFFTGAKLPAFQVELVGVVALMVLVILGPLLVFSPQLANVRRKGLREYGSLAQRYVREFDQKWLRGGAPDGEALLGNGDLQSLADLGNSFAVVKEMRLTPFNGRTAVQLGLLTLAPVAPLVLTMIPVEELLARLLRLAF